MAAPTRLIWLSLPSSRRVGQRGGLNSGPKGAPAQGGAWGKGVGRARLAGLARCCADSHFGGRLRERGAATRAGQADPGYVTRAHPSLPSAHEISPPQPARIVPTTVVGALPSRLRLPLCSDEGKHIKSIHVATTPASLAAVGGKLLGGSRPISGECRQPAARVVRRVAYSGPMRLPTRGRSLLPAERWKTGWAVEDVDGWSRAHWVPIVRGGSCEYFLSRAASLPRERLPG